MFTNKYLLYRLALVYFKIVVSLSLMLQNTDWYIQKRSMTTTEVHLLI